MHRADSLRASVRPRFAIESILPVVTGLRGNCPAVAPPDVASIAAKGIENSSTARSLAFCQVTV
jgi:hypothetical protein